jgi:hypothetical protein
VGREGLGKYDDESVKIMFWIKNIVRGTVQLGPLGITATNGLLCQPRVIMMMKKLVE